MSILTQSGRAAIAASIKKQSIHLAWGSGDANSGSSHQVEKVFVEGEIALDHHTIKDVRVFTGQTVYQSSVDYTVDSSTGVIKLTENSSITANSAVTVEYTQSTPPESINSIKLLNELGRRTADEVLFCTGDENGELVKTCCKRKVAVFMVAYFQKKSDFKAHYRSETYYPGHFLTLKKYSIFVLQQVLTPSGRFRPSNVPTNNLFLKFTFNFTDAANQVIRELGVMVGTKVKEKLPPGQRYFEPKDVENPGILLVLEHTVPLIRTSATRETFSFVVTF